MGRRMRDGGSRAIHKSKLVGRRRNKRPKGKECYEGDVLKRCNRGCGRV